MIITLTKDHLGHSAGTSIEVLDDVIGKTLIDHGYGKPGPIDPIAKAIQESVDALSIRVEAALDVALKQLAVTHTKSRRGQLPDIFGSGDRTDPKKTFGAFLLALRTGDKKALDDMGAEWDPWQKTAWQEQTGATGGFLVPTEHYQDVMMYAIDASIVRKYATIIPQGAKETEVPCLDVVTVPTAGNNAMLGGAVFTWTEENATEADVFTTAQLKQTRLINYELTGYAYLSNTLLEDSGGSLEAIVKRIFGTGVGWTEDYAFMRGNGAGKPLGIVNWAGLISVTRSGASAIALADISGMEARLICGGNEKKQFWAINNTGVAKLNALVATSTMYSIDFQRSAAGLMLRGRPVHVTDKLPALNTPGDILLCQGDAYLIGDRKQMSIAYSEGPRFTSNQMTWRVVHRVAGRPWASDKTTLPDATNTVGPFIALAAG